MPLQKALLIVGVAKQATRGTLAASPTFAHGVTKGSGIVAAIKEDFLPVTSGVRAAGQVYRTDIANSASFDTNAYMKALGLYLLAAIGTDTVTGTTPNFVHTFSLGALPYLSMFGKGLGTSIQAVADSKVDELDLSWDTSGPVDLTIKTMGTKLSFPSTFAPTTDESASNSFLIPLGGTFQYAVLGSTPATARISKGQLTIKNNLALIPDATSIEAADVFEGRQDHSISLTVTPDSLDDFRTAVTGSPTGTSSSPLPLIGSISLLFKENNGAGQLLVTSNQVSFICSLPDGDPKGGPAEIVLAGNATNPPSGTCPVTYALTNAQATY